MRISDSFPLFVWGSFAAHNEHGPLAGAHGSEGGRGTTDMKSEETSFR